VLIKEPQGGIMVKTTIGYSLNDGIIQATAWSKVEKPDPLVNDLYSFFGSAIDTVYVTNDETAANDFIDKLAEYDFDAVAENDGADSVQMIQVGALYLFVLEHVGLIDSKTGASTISDSLLNKFVVAGSETNDITLLYCIAGSRLDSADDVVEMGDRRIEHLKALSGNPELVDAIITELNNHADPFLKELDIDL